MAGTEFSPPNASVGVEQQRLALTFNPRSEEACLDLEFLVARYRQIEVPVFVSSKATRKWNELSFAHQGDVCIVGWVSIGETDRDRRLIELFVYFGTEETKMSDIEFFPAPIIGVNHLLVCSDLITS